MAKEFNHNIYVKNLPDCYRKSIQSNNNKILKVEKHALTKLAEDISAVFDTLDIWKATGKTLDLYGEMYNLPRENMEDDQYRLMILLKMTRNRAGSDHTSIVNALATALGLSPESLCILDSEISGNVDVDPLPYNVLQEAGISVKQVWESLKQLLAVGVGIGRLNVVHDLHDIDLKIATAITHSESFSVEVKPLWFESVNAELEPAITTMHAEYYKVEVV